MLDSDVNNIELPSIKLRNGKEVLGQRFMTIRNCTFSLYIAYETLLGLKIPKEPLYKAKYTPMFKPYNGKIGFARPLGQDMNIKQAWCLMAGSP